MSLFRTLFRSSGPRREYVEAAERVLEARRREATFAFFQNRRVAASLIEELAHEISEKEVSGDENQKYH